MLHKSSSTRWRAADSSVPLVSNGNTPSFILSVGDKRQAIDSLVYDLAEEKAREIAMDTDEGTTFTVIASTVAEMTTGVLSAVGRGRARLDSNLD